MPSQLARTVTRPDGTVLVERFSFVHRLEHLFIILCLLALLLTGLPQKFHEARWAIGILEFFGGLDFTRSIHHAVGVLLAVQLIGHLVAMIVLTSMNKLGLSLFPTPQDFRDIFITWKYRFGYSKVRPRFGKFDYRQKFEYLGLLLGGAVVVFSGLVLMVPGLVSRFLPGHIIPAARELHSQEALVALLVLVAWHLYGHLLGPDAYPMNKSIFTGHMTKEELKRRHVLEYERLFGRASK